MIILRQKEFVVSKNQINSGEILKSLDDITERAMKEIIKAIEMNDSIIGIDNQRHWIRDKIVTAIIDPLYRTTGGNVGVEILLSKNEEPGWEKLIDKVIREIRFLDKSKGRPKYVDFYGPKGDRCPPRPVEEWRLIFRYIALCLIGKMNPDVDDIWESYNRLRGMKVNTKKKVRLSPQDGLNIIAKCIDNILYGQGSKTIKEMTEESYDQKIR